MVLLGGAEDSPPGVLHVDRGGDKEPGERAGAQHGEAEGRQGKAVYITLIMLPITVMPRHKTYLRPLLTDPIFNWVGSSNKACSHLKGKNKFGVARQTFTFYHCN